MRPQARVVFFSSGAPELAVEILSAWLDKNTPLGINQWALIMDSAPDKFSATPKGSWLDPSTYKLEFEVNYGYLPGKRGTLTCLVKETANQTLTLTYDWTGPAKALTDYSSLDFKVLTFLFENIEKEFQARGCRYPGSNFRQKPAIGITKNYPRGNSTEKWWREFKEDSGEKNRDSKAWPNPQDYSEAVQNPASCVNDLDLQQCNAEMTSLGLPKVASGAFASVYEFTNKDKKWAVRCFNTRTSDQHERYKAISNFVLKDDLTYTVDFHYLTNGIRYSGAWYPILKMDWVKGHSFDAYIRSNLHKPDVLQKLRADFNTMMQQLRNNGIAHGDLQHGNIIVDQGALYLVDYDGMYVPELDGKDSNELGHRNYQHPGRNKNHFGAYLDNFSAWLIDTTLLCLIEDPTLWDEFNGGDECLLFRANDLTNPNSSKLFQKLLNHRSDRIRKASSKLLELLSCAVAQVPFLETQPEDSELVSIKLDSKELDFQR